MERGPRTLARYDDLVLEHDDVGRKASELLRAFRASTRAVWKPMPHQVPPDGDWYGWLLHAGRGAGKTDASANYVVNHVNGPPCLPGPIPHWVGIIAPTLNDAAEACFRGPSGIAAHDSTATLKGGVGGHHVHWPNGSQAKLFGASTPEDVERLRAGGNRCLVWLEELAAWRYLDDCWNHMRFGLRVGPRPHWVASTTPKPRPLIRKLVKGEVRGVVLSHASMYDNPHLPENIKLDLEDTYGGTTLGDQELRGLLIDQDENALWTRDLLNEHRVNEVPDDLIKISVGVDPSGGAGEQGIVVVGKQRLLVPDQKIKVAQHGYVLADRSCHLPPAGWGRRVVQTAVDYDADDIVVERNFGGDMAIATVQGAADDLGVSIPIREVTASRGKKVRAEPVAALSNRGRWHHVGRFDELEEQMCTWTEEAGYSPDRLDAAVWPAWHLKLVSLTAVSGRGGFGGGALARTKLA